LLPKQTARAQSEKLSGKPKEKPVEQGVFEPTKRLKHAHTDNSILVNQYRKMQFMICGFDWPKQIAEEKQKPGPGHERIEQQRQQTSNMPHATPRSSSRKVMAQFSHHFPLRRSLSYGMRCDGLGPGLGLQALESGVWSLLLLRGT